MTLASPPGQIVALLPARNVLAGENVVTQGARFSPSLSRRDEQQPCGELACASVVSGQDDRYPIEEVARMIARRESPEPHDRNQAAARWHRAFLEMLPAIQERARMALGHLDYEARSEAVQEVVAAALAAYVRLVELGRADLAYPDSTFPMF